MLGGGGVVLYRLRTEMRARWRGWLALAVIAGIAAGAVIALVGGARRTETVYSRFLTAQRAYDVLVLNGVGHLEPFAELDLDRVAHLPEVKASLRGSYY